MTSASRTDTFFCHRASTFEIDASGQLDYERESKLGLAVSANVLRVLDGSGVSVRDACAGPLRRDCERRRIVIDTRQFAGVARGKALREHRGRDAR